MKFSTTRQINIGFSLAIILIVVFGLASLKSSNLIKSVTEDRIKTSLARLSIRELSFKVADAESAQRGFLLTGKDRYLEPFNTAKQLANHEMQKLRQYYRSNVDLTTKLDQLNIHVLNKFAELKETIDLAKAGRHDHALQIVKTDRGIDLMTEIRTLAETLTKVEGELWNKKSLETNAAIDGGSQFSIAASIFGFILISAVWYFIRRHVANRENDERQDKEHMSAIIDLQNKAAAQSGDRQLLMDTVTAKAGQLTEASGAVIEMSDGDDMVYTAASGAAKASIGLRLKRGSTLSGLCSTTGQIQICDEVLTDSRVDQEACRRIGIRSMVVVPLRNDQEVIGVLKVFSAKPAAFTKKHIHLLELMSGFLGIMLDRAQATKALIKSEQEIRRLNESLEVTVQERTKELVEANISEQAAKQSSKVKSEFLANMSHEIRTPINGVLGMANVLLDSGLTEEQSEHAKSIVQCGETLLHLVNDILDLSKAESGKIELENIDFDLHQTVEDVQKVLSFQAAKKNLTFTSSFEKDVPKFVSGDPFRIRQILMNLTGNAIKFTSRGLVKIHISLINLSETEASIKFQVKDSGIGLSESAQRKIFKPFSQADSSTTRKYGGTGLGLSISKHLVSLMDGDVGVNSIEGSGSTFWFSVKLKTVLKSPLALPEQPVKLVHSQKLRLILAEDNSVNQMIAIHMLQKLGHSVVAVANGKELIDALRAAYYDVVFMDCQMPIMDGFEATEFIRTDMSLGCRDIKIVAMTANAMTGDREKCLAAGMDDYVSKPIRINDVSAVLNRIIKENHTNGRAA